MDKSHSESELTQVDQKIATPPNFATTRNKRRREEDDIDITSQLEAFKTEMKAMITSLLAEQGKELAKISPTLEEIQQSNANIESSMAFLTAQNDEFKKKIESLEVQLKHDRECIVILEQRIEDIQMSSRKANFVIKDVPKGRNETRQDLIDMAISLSQTIGGDLKKTDIKDIYRLKGKKEETNNTPIIVETSSTIIKTDMLKMSKAYNVKQKTKLCAKHLGLRSSEDTPIFICEQLTAKASRMHFLARDLVKTKKYKFCWTSFGKVYVKKDENLPAILIKSEAQIHQLSNQA